MKAMLFLITLAVACPALTEAKSKSKPASNSAPKVVVVPKGPFDFRGASLGMGRSEFRRLPFPDENQNGAMIICSGENKDRYQMEILPISEVRLKAGETVCQWMDKPTSYSGWNSHLIKFGSGPTLADAEYHFYKETETSEARLREVLVIMKTDEFAGLVVDLSGKFGSPSSIEENSVQNGFGNTFQNNTVHWENDKQSLVVIQRANKITDMAILFTDKELDAAYQARLKEAKGVPKL